MIAERILIIEEECELRDKLINYLGNCGYKAFRCSRGDNIIKEIMNHKINLIILDLDIKKSLLILTKIKKYTDIPVIAISSNNMEEFELEAYKIGVHDFITKPLNLKILLAKIKSIFKQLKRKPTIEHFYDIDFDTQNQILYVKGKEINLTPQEFSLLKYLVDHYGQALTREEILRDVWDFDVSGNTRTVDAHINQLRNKLAASRSFIKTVRNKGYKFEVNEEEVLPSIFENNEDDGCYICQ